jgi:RNA polymerase-binding transcription factor DksA
MAIDLLLLNLYDFIQLLRAVPTELQGVEMNLKERLIAERNSAEAQIRARSMRIHAGSLRPEDPTTPAEDLEEAFVTATTLSERLKLICAALRRIEVDRFGTCGNCGGQIGEKRLDAVPWTNLCLRCQEQFELSQAPPAPMVFGVR